MFIDPTYTYDDALDEPLGASAEDEVIEYLDSSDESEYLPPTSQADETANQPMGEIPLDQLKDLLSSQLRQPDCLKRPEGIATGYKPVDEFLLWSGLPKGHLTMFCGSLGTGATSLWIETANRVVKDGLWVGWINGDVPLAPQSLHQKKMDLGRLISIEKPMNEAKLFWVLQEMMSSSLFEFIGCDLGSLRLREHQLRKLQTQAREANVALVFLSQLKPPKGSAASILSLIVHFEKKQISIERALHRPTPHSIPRSITYARFTLHADHSRIAIDAKISADREVIQPSALSQTPRVAGNGL